MGRLHVDEMLSELSSLDFAKWLAWYCMEPRADQATAIYGAQIAQAIVNANRKRSSPYHLKDFLFRQAAEPLSDAEQIKALFGVGGEEPEKPRERIGQ